MLSSAKIIEEVNNKNIYIDNFNPEKLNPNSYNLTLNNKLLIYKSEYDPYIDEDRIILDLMKDNAVEELIIPEDGLILKPGILYLGSTNEYTETKNYVPMLDGRSSIGRLGIMVHQTAGFGDIGFIGKWTLEITVVHPIFIYPNIEICQISYQEVLGDISSTYHGKYYNQNGPVKSMMYKEF